MTFNIKIIRVHNASQDGYAVVVYEPRDPMAPDNHRQRFESDVFPTPADAIEEAKDFCAWTAGGDDVDYRVIDEESMVASGDF